jgi:hypothetical protein
MALAQLAAHCSTCQAALVPTVTQIGGTQYEILRCVEPHPSRPLTRALSRVWAERNRGRLVRPTMGLPGAP